MKKAPFKERPTWQQVKDMQEALTMARSTLRGLAPLTEGRVQEELLKLSAALEDVR
jgi:hypothetical protein